MKMSEQKDQFCTILIYGPSKVGKTVLASQFPNPYFIALDPQCLTSVRALMNEFKLSFDADIIEIDSEPTTDPAFIELCGKAFTRLSAWEKFKKLTVALLRHASPDTTVIIDNLSRMAETLHAHIRGTALGEGKFKKLEFKEWNEFTAEIDIWAQSLNTRGRSCNVVLIGHEEPQENQLTGEIKRYLLMPTKAKHRIPSIVTDFLYMHNKVTGKSELRKIVRNLRSKPMPDTDTGSRCLIPDVDNPTFKDIQSYIEGAIGRKLPKPNWTPPQPK